MLLLVLDRKTRYSYPLATGVTLYVTVMTIMSPPPLLNLVVTVTTTFKV